MTPEGIVVAAVEQYFSQPKFREFSVKKEDQIQFGSRLGFADVVLIDSKGNRTTIVECKRDGVKGDGVAQLKSYLCATDTPFGLFANSKEPESWKFYENLGRNRFRDNITCSEFEKRVVKSENNSGQLNRKLSHHGSSTPLVENKEGRMKIRPTLYVGLGTTGKEILNYLRELNYQEYGHSGLPIFRYISIETDNSSDGTTPQIEMLSDSAPYGMNKVITTTIPYTQPIHEKLRPNSQRYNKHLAEWLDEDILNAPATTRSGGAGNLRMIGRLSLWENWNQQMRVQQHLREAYDTVCEDKNMEQATDILNRHFGNKVEIDKINRNVFVVGTLCGGTCSGMLLDIAYYFRHIGTVNSKLYGIFTIYDEALTSDAPKIQLANCYASLVELDYYQRSDIPYQVTFPNGPAINTSQPPFDISTFLSATNMKGRRFIKNGQFDQEQLDRMIAFELFVRSFGVDALIDADLVNAAAFDSQFEKVREENQFVQYMFSSGLDSVWLPKTKVVKAAAIEYIKTLGAKWRERYIENTTKVPDTSDLDIVFKQLLDDIGAALVKTDGTPLVKLLDNDCSMISLNNRSTEAQNCLRELIEGGKHHQLFDKNRNDYLNQINSDLDNKSEEFLNQLKERIQNELANPTSNYPDNLASFADIDTRVQKAEKLSTIERRVFLTKRSEFDIQGFRGRISQEQAQLRDQLRAYFVKKVLSALYDDIPKRQAKIRKADQERKSDQTSTESKLKQCFNLEDTNLSAPIVRAAKRLAQEHQDELASREQVDSLIQDLQNSGPNYFYGHIVQKFTNSSRFNTAVTSVIQEFDSDTGRRSSPYQALTPNYLGNYRLRLERPGGDTRLFRFFLTEQQLENTSVLTTDAQVEFREFPISHLRVAYQMEAGFTIDDLCVTKRLKEEYDAYQLAYRRRVEEFEGTGNYPIHIHKDLSKFNPDAIRARIETSNRTEEVEKDWRALRELLPRIREKNANLFQYISPNGNFNGNGNLNGNGVLEAGELEATVIGRAGIKLTFRDETGHEKLAQDADSCDSFINTTRKQFKELLNETPSLREFIDDFNRRIENRIEREQSEQFYTDYLHLLEEHST